MRAVDHDLPGIFKVDRYTPSNDRLHLTQAPIRLVRVPHQHARFQDLHRILFMALDPK
jgi:hypothetical protein